MGILNPNSIEVGVVGIGLMGSSIIVSLLKSGHIVKAIAPISEDFANSDRIKELLLSCSISALVDKPITYYLNRLCISMDYSELKNCNLVIECVIEDIDIKRQVYKQITNVVANDVIIASNTSAIAISILQNLVEYPKRFIGIHFAEPAYATRFLEITCGDQTDQNHADWVFDLADCWGKEPTLLRKDIKGFITNRLMYAVYREMFHLIENNMTSMENADKAFRYSVGSWITLMGLFRRMDYTGVQNFVAIFENIFPKLSNADEVPTLMKKIVQENAKGIQNLSGLYEYSKSEAEEWEKSFLAFNEEIFKLAAQYPSPTQKKEEILT